MINGVGVHLIYKAVTRQFRKQEATTITQRKRLFKSIWEAARLPPPVGEKNSE